MQQPHIDYPFEWDYRIIGSNEEAMRNSVTQILSGKVYNLSFSNRSRAGKYVSLTLKITVHSDDERNALYTHLRKSPVITSVL